MNGKKSQLPTKMERTAITKPLLGSLPEFRTRIENAHDFEKKIIDIFEGWDDYYEQDRVLDADFYDQVAYEIKTLFTEFINENYEFKGKK